MSINQQLRVATERMPENLHPCPNNAITTGTGFSEPNEKFFLAFYDSCEIQDQPSPDQVRTNPNQKEADQHAIIVV